MKILFLRATLAAAVLASAATGAVAQDQCRDVLKNGAFNSVDIWSRSEYREIITSRFLQSTYESSLRSDSGVGGKSIGELVMGVSAYSAQEYNQRKASIRLSYDYSLTRLDEWSLATRTADPGIVAAWSDCMGAKSPLTAHFETQPGDGANVTLVVSMRAVAGVTMATVSGDTFLPPEARALNQAQFDRCLGDGAVITASVPCRVALHVPADQTLKVIVSSPQGDAEANLGRRLRYVTSSRPFHEESGLLVRHNNTLWRSATISIPAADVTAGWTFRPGSIQRLGPQRTAGSGDGWCRDYSQTVTATSLSYRIRVRATDNMDTRCRVTFDAVLEKSEFVPDV